MAGSSAKPRSGRRQRRRPGRRTPSGRRQEEPAIEEGAKDDTGQGYYAETTPAPPISHVARPAEGRAERGALVVIIGQAAPVGARRYRRRSGIRPGLRRCRMLS